jgi:hypothetical protein
MRKFGGRLGAFAQEPGTRADEVKTAGVIGSPACDPASRIFLRNSFDTSVKINNTMTEILEVMFKRIFAGWAVVLSDGREIARFRGPFARARARRLVFG